MKKLMSFAAALTLTGFTNASVAALGDLNVLGSVLYGDGQSISLPLAQIVCGANPGGTFTGVDCTTYSVKSTPGAIQDLIVVATGSSGLEVTTNAAGMDGAYATPNSDGINFFSTGTFADPGQTGTINHDYANSWDASLASLKTFLGSEEVLFFFNNNNTNDGDGQTLAAWARLWVTDPSEKIVGDFLFTNDNNPYRLFTEGGGGTFLPPGSFADGTFNNLVGGVPVETAPDGDGTNADTDYVVSGGPICYTALLAPVSCGNPLAVGGPVNHNLGANEVAYVVRFPELNALLQGLFVANPADLADYTFHMDLRLGCDPTLYGNDPKALICAGEVEKSKGKETILQHGKNLNNGFEQLFIGKGSATTTVVPEPATLALLGGMLGIWALLPGIRRRRAKLS